MNTHTLGDTDIVVPEICLGTMTWGQQNSEADAHEQLSYAVDERGLTFMDTAEIYPIPPTPHTVGLTETYIGNWLKKRGKRDDLCIASKISPANFMSHRTKTGKLGRLDRDSVREAVEGSLRRLQTDYIDVYQIHWPVRSTNFFGVRGFEQLQPDDSTPIEETLTALQAMIKEGKIRHIGVSNETPWGLNEYLRLAREKGLPKIVSIQNQYSLVNRTFEIGHAEICMREQVSMLAYSALSMGTLTGKYLDGAKPSGARFTLNERNTERYNPDRAQEAIRRYVDIANKHKLDPAQMAYAFAVSRQFMTSVIIGASTLDQLKTAINTRGVVLSSEVLEDIESVHKDFPDVVA